MDIHELTAVQLGAAYADAALSPVEAAESCLARIEAFDSEINAFCLVDPDTSLKAAEESEARWAAGEPRSLLDGVPVAVKDLLLTKEWPTRRGSLTVDPSGTWTDDAPAVARLKEAGAVLIGKTTTPEFGWKGCTDSPLTGITRNPWMKSKTPGGSSGGSAAAVAARLAPLALGTDGGGSIRIPASFCGIFGLKPSFGRVPAFPLSPFGTVAHVGPMSRTVHDSALLMNVIARPDPRDWHSLAYDGVDYAGCLAQGVKGKRVAFSPRLGYVDRVDAQVDKLVAAAAGQFSALGAHVEEADRGLPDPSLIFRTLWWAGAGFLLGDMTAEKMAQLDPGLRRMAEEGRTLSLKDYLSANAARGEYGSKMRQFMQRYDIILTPSVATPPFDVAQLTPLDEDGNAWMAWTPFSFPFNLTQQPAASVNCGFTREGLPVGLQIVGKMFDDAGVLAAAAAFEAACPTCVAVPPGF